MFESPPKSSPPAKDFWGAAGFKKSTARCKAKLTNPHLRQLRQAFLEGKAFDAEK